MARYRHHHRHATRGVGAAVVLCIAAAVPAQPCLDAKLVSDDIAERDAFGSAVSISGDVAAVATNVNGNGTNDNTVYVFRRDGGGWSQEAKLTTPDGFDNLDFGRSVAVAGDVLVVGAHKNFPFSGQGYAFVYRHDPAQGSWQPEAALFERDVRGDPAASYGFLVAIAPGADLIVVASSEFSRSLEVIKPVYVYRPGHEGEPWRRVADMLIARPGANNLHIPANWLDADEEQFIGGYAGGGSGGTAGEARIHRFDTAARRWIEEAILGSPDGLEDSGFGLGASILDDVAAVTEHDDLSGFGAVHVYRRADDGTWPLETSIRGDETRRFTFDVDVQQDVVFVSGTREGPGGARSPAVFVYRHDGSSWRQDDFACGDGLPIDDAFFGRRIDADATHLIVASKGDGEAVDFGGAAYVFGGVPGEDCNRNGIPDACDLLDGSSPDANGNGVPDECDPPVCQGAEATVYVDLDGFIVGGPLDGHRYFGILIGTPGNDVLVGTGGDELIIAGRGDDIVCGGGGEDRIINPVGAKPAAHLLRPGEAATGHQGR